MFPTSKLFFSVGGILSTGVFGFLTAYETTKKTVSDGLDGKRIIFGDYGSSQLAWGKLAKKIKDNKVNKNPKSDLFKSLDKDVLTEINYSGLKDLCVKANSQIYSTLTWSNETLLEDVKDFCTITIKEVFEELSAYYLKTEQTESNSDKSKFINNLKTLKTNHDENQYGKLVKGLWDMRNNLPENFENDNESWKTLAKWCDNSYKLTFLHEKEDLVKQINVYCQRPNSEVQKP